MSFCFTSSFPIIKHSKIFSFFLQEENFYLQTFLPQIKWQFTENVVKATKTLLLLRKSPFAQCVIC